MKYESKVELLVLMSIQELGEASIEEIQEYIKNHWQQLTDTQPQEISKGDLLRLVRRWNKRKAVAQNLVEGEIVYSLADVSWYPKNQIIRCLKTPDESEAKSFIQAYENKLKDRGSLRLPQSVYRDYKSFELTFETIDSIAGGMSNGERKLSFPRKENGDLHIPINWLKGWTRDNSGLADLPQVVFVHKTGFSIGEFLTQPKVMTKQVKVKEGMSEYEYIGSGEKFKTIITYPMHGTKVTTKEQLEAFFKKLEVAPIRGLGANPAAFGGRVKLLEMKEIT